jgi:hypothetical protein
MYPFILGSGLLKDILKTHRVNVYASKHNKTYKVKKFIKVEHKKIAKYILNLLNM